VDDIATDLIPIRRPHFELREGHLFFLLSRRPHADLDPGEVALWNGIDGVSTVGRLDRAFPGAVSRLRRFRDLGVCELALDPGSARGPRSPEGRRRVLVLEPHMDDAVLSVGGLMWSRRETCEFTLVSVTGRTNFSSYYYLDRDFFDVARVTQLRLAESALVMRLLGGRHRTLDQVDSPLRYHPGDWSLAWYRRNWKPVGAYMGHSSSDGEIETWARAIGALLATTEAEEVWLPLGVGVHTDHELARDACLRALTRLAGLESRTELYLYQDVPYAVEAPAHTGGILAALAAAGGVLEQQSEDIGAALAGKLRLASIYGSQFKPDFMAPRIVEAARLASPSGTGRSELRFRVRALPGPVEPLAVYSNRAAVERLRPALARWFRRHRAARRIRLLSPVPVGRWVEDITYLMERFPQARFEVHVSRECADETSRLVSPRLEVRVADGTGRGWLARLLRIAVARPCPTIVLVGEGRPLVAHVARVACLPCDPLVTTRADHLVLALRGLGDPPG
jgi:LmbE family N-acetylglucosaminyl deacetylase